MASPGAAQEGAAQGVEAAQAIAAAYDRFCLSAFPDEAALRRELARADAIPLSAAEVRTMLHDDPGEGWRLPGTPFTLTLEAPPYRTCAIRRMTRNGLPTAEPYEQAVKAYARRSTLRIAPLQSASGRLPSGADTVLRGTPLVQPGRAQPIETSYYAVSTYHGRLDPARFPDAVGGPGVEIRLAHQITPKQ